MTEEPTEQDVKRFWSKVQKTDGCWIWTGKPKGTGYGEIRFINPSRLVYAHRLAYELLVGKIPEGLELDHLCRNRICVNPQHLEPVTHQENILRGEGPPAKQAQQTRCIHEHLLEGDNLYIRPDNGARICVKCTRERSKSYERLRGQWKRVSDVMCDVVQ